MNKYFSKNFWLLNKHSIQRSEIIAIMISTIVSFLLFFVVEKNPENDLLWGISINSWRAVASSVLAASIFLFVQWVISQLKQTETDLYKLKYETLIDENGLKNIYYQRGSRNIISVYKSLISNSEERIWAIGMTNNHFCNQHFDNILDKMEKKRGKLGTGKEIDFVVSFWNPDVSFFNDQNNEQLHKILEVQNFIEKKTFSHSNWEKIIEARVAELKTKIEARRNLRGRVRIIYITLPTNFTTFIIDDDVFFFPYLSGPDSTTHPTIHCSSEKGMGKAIVSHYQKILENPTVVITKYENNTL